MHPTDDDTVDPLDLQDQEDEVLEADAVVVVEDAEETPAQVEQDQEIAKALAAVITPEVEEPVKAKPHMISDDLILRPLTPEDWFDEGTL